MLLHQLTLTVGLVLGAPPPTPVAEIVPDVMPGDVELAVIPTPRRARMGDGMIAVGRVALCVPAWDDLRAGGPQLAELLQIKDAPKSLTPADALASAEADTLALVGHPDRFPALAEGLRAGPHSFDSLRQLPNNDQGYILSVRWDPAARRNVILIAASTGQGAYYAIQTLRQLTWVKDGRVHVREAEILDWPAFPARGSKRPSGAWEWALKGNFCYEIARDLPAAQRHFADWYVAAFLPSVSEMREGRTVAGLLDASPAGVTRALNWVQTARAAGARDYCVHVDDQKEELAAESAKLFHGDYHAALAHLLRQVYAAVKEADPKATLYFCPVPYWTLADYETSAGKLRAVGGLPEDCGLMLCGPEVTSGPIPAADVARYSRLYGARRKALIYDNHLRDLDLGPVPARDPALADVAIGISPERGTATTRATRLDWAWNPEAYDPQRSLLLACREFAGFQNWRKVYDMVASIEYALPGPEDRTRAEVLARIEGELARGGRLIEELRDRPDAGLEGRLTLPRLTAGRFEHPAHGLIDEAAVCRRALSAGEIARVMKEGLGALYPALPAEPDAGGALARADFLAAWLFDEAGGTTARDLTGRGHDGRLDSAAVLAGGGVFGGALSLPPSGGCVTTPYAEALASETFTLMAWVKLRPAGKYALILSRAGGKPDERQGLLVAHGDGGLPYLHGGTGARVKVDDDQWHHLAATFDGAFHRFYVDGRLQSQAPPRNPPRPVRAAVHLGAYPLAAPVNPLAGFAFNVTDQAGPAWTHLAVTRRDLIARHAFREIECPAAVGPIAVDGAPDEEVWARAPEASDFVLSGAGTLMPPDRQARFRCLRDERCLYIALRVAGKVAPGDRPPRDDLRGPAAEFIRVLIDPRHTHREIYDFRLAANGDRFDGYFPIGPAAGPTGLDWDSGWTTSVRAGPEEWTAEIAIPLAALGVAPGAGDVMGLQVWHGRALWSYVPRWWGVQEPTQLGHLRVK